MAFPNQNGAALSGDLNNATNRARVGGSGFTYLHWDNQLVGFINQFTHTSGRPVAPVTPVHPMDSAYAVELITPAAMGPGTIVAELFQMYGAQVWDRLSQLTGAVDIVDVFQRVANSDHPISMVKYISPPKLRGKTMAPYTVEYHNCVISDIADTETVDVTTMQILQQVTFMYTHMTRGGKNPNVNGANNNVAGARNSTSTSFG